MTGIIKRMATAAVVLVVGTSPAAAQRPISAEVSLGGVVATYAGAGGLYLDAGKSVLRTTSVIGEVQLFQSNATELVALGGVRQQLFRSSKGDLYAQALFGAAAGYSRRCDLCSARVTELGVGANVILRDGWALRVRGDIRTGGSAADLLWPTLGVGITRGW